VTDTKRFYQAINTVGLATQKQLQRPNQGLDQNIAVVMTPPARNKLGQHGLNDTSSD
jgi:hypothetical protein